MLKAFCVSLFLGVLFVGCSCDIDCFVEKLFQRVVVVDPQQDVTDIINCQNAIKDAENVRDDAKNCSLEKIKVDEWLGFLTEVCTVGGDLNNKYRKHEECFGVNIGKAKECLEQVELKIDMKQLELLKYLCGKLGGLYTCFNEKIGNACGEEALGLTQNLTSALSSYTTGICAEINGASVNHMLCMNILLGLLFVLMMGYYKN